MGGGRGYSLAVGGTGAVVHGDHVLSGLLGVAGLLGDDGNAVGLEGLDTDGLLSQLGSPVLR